MSAITESDVCFSVILDYNLAIMAEEDPVDRLSFVKTINEENKQKILPLPKVIHPNLHRHGIYPISVERWMYTSKAVRFDGERIYVPNGLKALVIEKAKELFNETELATIKYFLNARSKRTGKFTQLRFPKFGDSLSAWSWLPDEQVFNFILQPCKNPLNWKINPDLEEHVMLKSSSIKMGFKGLEFSSSHSETPKLSVINNLSREISFLIHDVKKSPIGPYHFRIHKIHHAYERKSREWDKIRGRFALLVGHFEKIGTKLFFCDANYLASKYDRIQPEGEWFSDDIEFDKEYIVIGIIKEGCNYPIIDIWALIKTRSIYFFME